MKTHSFFKPAVLTMAAMAALAGCSTAPQSNARLEEARTNYRLAQDNPRVTQMAGAEMQQATQAMDVANSAWERKDDTEAVNHWAYLAQQRVAIAQATTDRKVAELSVAQAKANSNELRLNARTQEANAATAKAALSQQQADAAKRQADALKNQATSAQMMALSAEQRANDLEARLKELNAKRTERGMVMTMGDVLFDTDQAQLKSGGEVSVGKLANFMTTYPDRVVLIEGFTDSTGSDAHNQDLSVRRAEAVRNSLLRQGIASRRLTTLGHGEANPIATNDTASGRQMNRRVEVLLSDEGGKISLR